MSPESHRGFSRLERINATQIVRATMTDVEVVSDAEGMYARAEVSTLRILKGSAPALSSSG